MTIYDSIQTLEKFGISYEDAVSLRRISMTLHRWHEMECGDSNDYASWCIVRGKRLADRSFQHDESGSPFIESHPHRGDAKTKYEPIPDRERGALKRLATILERYPNLGSYVQGDPRGASLYIIPRDRITNDMTIDSCYSSIGIAVCK
jgi:hypothetical protein